MMNIIKINAFIGSITTIRTAPTNPPIKAPTIGIKAVSAVNAPIGPAYGIPRIHIPKAQSVPNITASFACPVKKLRKESLESLLTLII